MKIIHTVRNIYNLVIFLLYTPPFVLVHFHFTSQEMSKSESRKVNIIQGSIATFLLSDAELFIETKFGSLGKKEKDEDAKLRAKALKEFAEDMKEVYSVDSQQIQDMGSALIAELAVSMNSTLLDLVSGLNNNGTAASKNTSSKKRKTNAAELNKPSKVAGKKAK